MTLVWVVPYIWHVSAVKQMPGIEIKLLDWALEMALVKGHPFVFGWNICYIRIEDYLFYQKKSYFLVLFVKYS